MYKIFRFILMVMAFTMFVEAKKIKICTDENFWYPFTYSVEEVALGLHVDITKEAIKRAGHSVEYIPMPWKRCLASAKSGEVDAIVSASYKDKRGEFLYYPKDAKSAKKSKNRITQVEYVVLTHKDDSYKYDGNIKTLPHPIRATFGYSIVDDLKKEGLSVDTSKKDTFNLKRLQRDKKGSVVTLKEIVEYYESKGTFKGEFVTHKKPIKSKSYYMPFSKNTKISQDDMQDIWDNIQKVRENKRVINSFLERY
jgi:polar amino acid transport system substrate-binding protein